MAKALEITDLLIVDNLGREIADKYLSWETHRTERIEMWKEAQEYIFATDTTQTSNSKLPWSNKTTIPKLCQIRDNLHSNYMAALFPNKRWVVWEGNTLDDQIQEKRETIESYMHWVTNRNHFYNTCSRLVYDYIDTGNCFAMPEWVDETNITDDKEQVGYVGPSIRRISPLDIVFDPTVPHFENAPKIVRSLVSMGEVKDMIMNQASTEEHESAEALWNYLKDVRNSVLTYEGPTSVKDRVYDIAGLGSFRDYLCGDTVEVLTFYGDIYDSENDNYLRNVCIKIVDRHKVIYNKTNPTFFGYPPIFHAGWRLRPDNLWAMGPLENLIGMQYRIDHLENMKSDVFDLVAYPPLKITGYVEDFTWGPMERIYVGDDGNVEIMSPNVQALNADNQIAILELKMEEMAGSPKEAMGFRTPGEKTKYEVQSLENAASRVFQNKIQHFERHIIENVLNGMLELAKRNMNKTTIRAFDDETKSFVFTELSRYDITGSGTIKPVAARHFAEKANMIQNLTQFMNSAVGNDQEVIQHFSSLGLAKLFEELLDIKEYKLVKPYARIDERADQARLSNNQEEQVSMETMTPSGIMPGDFDV